MSKSITTGESIASTALVIFSLLWALFGFIAFVYSLFCLGRSGTFFEKVLGFVIALFTGPLFFVYLNYSQTYCK
jgi:hypothetical protein